MGTRLESVRAPAMHSRTANEFAFRRALRSVDHRQIAVPPPRREDVLALVGSRALAKSPAEAERRLRASEYGCPGPLHSSAVRVRSLGRRLRRAASAISRRAEKSEKRRTESGSALPKLGATRLSSSGTELRIVGERSSEACPCRRECAGRVPHSLGTKPPLCPSGLFATISATTPGCLRVWRRPAIWRCAINEGPGEKRTHACMRAPARRLPTDPRPRSQGNEECPHLRD